MVKLERSEDAVSFSPVHSYSYDGNATRSFRDYPGTGTFYYRLRIESAGSPGIFSTVVQLTINKNQSGWKPYPTIVKPGESLTINNMTGGLYNARLSNSSSTVVYRATFNAFNGKGTIVLPQEYLAPGTYYLIIDKDGSRLPGSEKIVVRAY